MVKGWLWDACIFPCNNVCRYVCCDTAAWSALEGTWGNCMAWVKAAVKSSSLNWDYCCTKTLSFTEHICDWSMSLKLNKLYPICIFVTESQEFGQSCTNINEPFFWISKRWNWGNGDLSSGTITGADVVFGVFSGHMSGNAQEMSYYNPGLA